MADRSGANAASLRRWLTICAAGLAGACGGSADPPAAPADEARTEPPGFVERAAELGIRFEHFNGATGEAFLAEIMGSGAALFDYDNDGDLDAYLVQGGRMNPDTPLRFPATETGTNGALFENRLVPDGVLGFRAVPDNAGIVNAQTGMGIATGDVDNDGDVDVYLTNLGPDRFFLNNGDGTFTDASSRLSEPVDAWSTSAVFVDYNADGALDLAVARYVDMDRVNARQCSSIAGERDYCTPDIYQPLTDVLLAGDGSGSLRVLPDWQGTSPAPSTGLGIIAGDFDGDGASDLYVANDKKPNQLWRNAGNDQFEDIGIISGSALNSNGKEEASMGVSAGDMDGDGDDDIFITHLKGETNTLYLNNGGAAFFDATNASGLGATSIPSTGFGTHWFDADNDGDLDLFAANGAVMAEPAQIDSEPFPYVQRNQLFENQGGGRFVDASAAAGFASEVPEISRGAAFGDVDNDGDVDILVSNNHGPARLLINEHGSGAWLSIRLRDETGNRDGVGARIGVRDGAGTLRWRAVGTGGSYLSASDIRTHIGLGSDAGDTVTLQVRWPDGETESWNAVKVNEFVTLTRGSGE